MCVLTFCRQEFCVGRGISAFHQIHKDIFALTIGNDDTNASLRDLRGRGVLGVHAATAKGTLLGFDILREVAPWGYLRDYL
jgi:hypothetical protein